MGKVKTIISFSRAEQHQSDNKTRQRKEEFI